MSALQPPSRTCGTSLRLNAEAPIRVAFVAAYAAPFHIPGLNALAERCDLHVLYLDDTRSHDVSHKTMIGGLEPPSTMKRSFHIQLDRSDLNIKVSVGASRWLARVDPDVLFVLGYVPAVWETLAWARLKKIPIVMWSESSVWTGSVRSGWSQATRRRLVRLADVQVSNGSQASEFLRLLDYPADRIVESPYPIQPPPIEESDDDRSGPVRVLFAGRLIERKRPMDVIDACDAAGVDIDLRLAGDGPLGDHIRDQVDGLAWASSLGRLDAAELAQQYAWADVVVVPSEREVWGLVVNEALAHGCYVVASDEVASAMDLIPGDDIGTIYPAGDVGALTESLEEVAGRLDRSAAGRAARRREAREHAPGAFDPGVWADAAMSGIEMVAAQ